MKERTPSPTTPISRNAGPTYPISVIEDGAEGSVIDNPNAPTVVEAGSDAETLDFCEVQVERIQNPNGNETVITTKTTYLPNGTRRIVKTIESIEEGHH
jgi:hypothetical protein